MSRQFLRPVFLAVITTAFLQVALAQTSTSSVPASKSAKPCSLAEHRQFDFWLGDWDVTVAGQPAGTNSIQLILGECVLLENWMGAKGGSGKSFNLFNAPRGKWQQAWVDNSGNVLELFGEFKNGVMQLTGETTVRGKKTLQRITWHPLDKDKVRQHWEQSQDEGKTWNTAFDGLYTRKK